MKMHFDVLEDRTGRSFFVASCEDKDGTALTKHLSYEQMLAFLSDSGVTEKAYCPMGRLPAGYVDAEADTEGGGKVKVYVPPAKRVFFLRLQEDAMPASFIVPMPAMLFEVCYGGKRLGGSCCVVSGTYEEVVSDYYSEGLVAYRYPFANVSHKGSICMGNIDVEVKRACDAGKFVSAFFDGVSNADYYEAESRLKSKMGQMEFLGSLSKMEEFPLEELFPLGDSGLEVPYEKQRKRA